MMAYFHNSTDINQTFIIEPLSITGGSPTISACTTIYSNALTSCSGDTTIFMGNGIISFDGNIYTNNDLTADEIAATTFYSGGTNLLNIINSIQITGGTFDNNLDKLTLYKENGGVIDVTGFTDYYTTGTTLVGNTVYFDRNDLLSAYTLDLSSFAVNTYTTGLTFNNNEIIITRNDGISLNTFINTMTGLTVDGLFTSNEISANTVSATTFYGDGSQLTSVVKHDTYVTGGTYSNGITTFTNNTGSTFSVSGYSTGYTLTSSAITDTLGYTPLSAYTDTLVTGGTYNQTNGTALFTNNTGGTFTLSGFSNDITQTFYDSYIGTRLTPKNTSINGFAITKSINGQVGYRVRNFDTTGNGAVSSFSAGGGGGGLYDNSVSLQFFGQNYYIPYLRNTGGVYSTNDLNVININNTKIDFRIGSTFGTETSRLLISTGGTLNTGNFSATTISATTYQNLPLDIRITGGTYNQINGITTFTNNTGGTFNVSGYFKSSDDIYTTGLTFNPNNYNLSVSKNDGSTYVTNLAILATDMTITGGSYNINTGIVTFTNNTGGTFNVSGFTSGMTDSYTSSAYLSGETIYFNNNIQGPNFYNVNLNPVLGNYVPFTGATRDVNIGENNFTTTSNIYARNFLIDQTPYGELLIGDNSQYNRISFVSNDSTNSGFGTSTFITNVEEGTIFHHYNDTFNSRYNYYASGSFFDVSDTENGNNFNVEPNSTFSAKLIRTDEGFNGNYVQFNTGTTETIEVGKIVWNQADGTFDMGLLNSVTLQAGQEMHMYAKASGVIANGDAVQFAGAQGDHLLVKKAVPSEINANPEYFVGIATQDFANNDFGYVTVFGQVRELNTSMYSGGTVLYYQSSGTTAGLLTDVRPTGPLAKITVAAVVRSHNNQGAIFVRPHVMPKIDTLQDVVIDDVQSDDILTYDAANSVWTNKGLEDVIGYIPAQINAEQSSGVVIEFQLDTVYGTLASPETATGITANVTGAELGVTCLLIHNNNSVAPTFSSEFKKLSGSGDYVTGQINYVFFNYITDTEIIYSINQRA